MPLSSTQISNNQRIQKSWRGCEIRKMIGASTKAKEHKKNRQHSLFTRHSHRSKKRERTLKESEVPEDLLFPSALLRKDNQDNPARRHCCSTHSYPPLHLLLVYSGSSHRCSSTEPSPVVVPDSRGLFSRRRSYTLSFTALQFTPELE